MGLTDLAKGIWNSGRYLLGGVALASVFLASPTDVFAEEDKAQETEKEADKEKEAPKKITKPSDYTPVISPFREKSAFISEIREIARGYFNKISIDNFKEDIPSGLKTDVRMSIFGKLGNAPDDYQIDLSEILEEEYDSAKPGLLRKSFHDLGKNLGKFCSEKRDHAGGIFGYTIDFHKETPSDTAFEKDEVEDYEHAAFFRLLGDENFAFLLRGAFLAEEDKNQESDGHFYADGILKLLGDIEENYFRIHPILRGGPHVYSGFTTFELGISLKEHKAQLIAFLSGGYAQEDNFFDYEDQWQPDTYRWTEIDQRKKLAQGEIGLEFRFGDRRESIFRRPNRGARESINRICLFCYYKDEDRLYDYRKDYEGTINTKRYRYEWDFFENELVATAAYFHEPEHLKGVYVKILAQYRRLRRREKFDNPNQPIYYRTTELFESGLGRAVIQFPFTDHKDKDEMITQGMVVVGGEHYRHYAYIGFLLEYGDFNHSSWIMRKNEEITRPEAYVKRNNYFKEQLTGEGYCFGFFAGYYSMDQKNGEKDRLYAYGGLRGVMNFKNFGIYSEAGYYHEVLTRDHPFDLHAELAFQFRTSKSNHILGIGLEFDLESEDFDSVKDRKMWVGGSVYWSF